ncbi:hypothetical protein BU24DRAFT_458406 [Aaosphaeria arxii CBS 175.79]|uniref:Uncharacterized protein n=1 Tax=Aaosphaeria arxii CBS 175.79 TaxID=1450172 RepID=A0A6A5Y153_9PLEO|nr:uncharacterized protein BU24DRAFT_458406 [Aaosphaeria arxii CBS 175.79]KAF2018651.1 hypothetical protein BU24DRAFT_458406 [Aaosphaeria arxii CBS 175.79]
MTHLIDLAELQLARELKTFILADVRALYGPTHGSLYQGDFDILTAGRTSYLGGVRYDYLTAQAIVYKKPDSPSQWKLLVAGPESGTVSGALKALWTEVQAKSQNITGPLQPGESYKGSKNL